MNAERLHSLAIAVVDDLRSTAVIAALNKLATYLQNQVGAPQEPTHQQQVVKQRQTLAGALEAAQSNRFPAIWKQLLVDMKADQLLGLAVNRQVDEIFQRNGITPSVALEEIRALHKRIEELQTAVDSLIKAFQQLQIPSESLAPGQVELGVLIPRSAVDNRLREFGQELTKLNGTLGVFSELAVGNRGGFPIRAISSSDLSVFLEVAPQVGACVAIAIERVVALYKSLLEIRRLREEMSKQGLSDEELSRIDQHAHRYMERGLEPVVRELIDKYAADRDEGRRNELSIELRIALNQISNRIDSGYNLEVRTEQLAPDQQAADPSMAANIAAITNAATAMQFLRLEGAPILELPESTETSQEQTKATETTPATSEEKGTPSGEEKKKGKR